MHHDMIVLGTGPAGCSAAITAAGQGLDVLLVETTGLHAEAPEARSTILLHLLRETILDIYSAHRILAQSLSRGELRRLFAEVIARQRQEVLTRHFEALKRELAGASIEIAAGPCTFVGPRTIRLGAADVREAPLIVIAVDNRPRRPEQFPFDERVVCDVDSILEFGDVPRSLVVVGGDWVGCEFACLFAALGSSVTLVDRRTRLLRHVDSDLRGILHERMQRDGVTIALEEGILDLRVDADLGDPHAVIRLTSDRVEICERVLVAAGWEPNVEGLGLEIADVQTDAAGFILVDDKFRTSQQGIYAIGGVVDPLRRIGADLHQGQIAALLAVGCEVTSRDEPPIVIYTLPEIALVGLTEESCQHLEIAHAVGSARFSEIPLGRIRSDEDGLLKLVVARDDHCVLGVHVIGTRASELIHLGAALLQRKGSIEEVAHTSFNPYCFAEAYRLAAQRAIAALGGQTKPAPVEPD